MILQIDMGNTRIKWRLREDSRSVARGSFLHGDALETFSGILSSYKPQLIERILVASVVSVTRNEALTDWALKALGIVPEFAVPQAMWGGIKNGYLAPGLLGVDRWLGIVAGYQRARGPCLVISCGSAITVDVIDAAGEHQGGYIAPGVMMAKRALALNTDSVGAVDVDNTPPFTLMPGRDTQSAVDSALAAMATGLVQQARQQLLLISESKLPPQLYITGGDAEWLAHAFPEASVIPDLVFDGLGLAFCAG